jgi:hypothetical protein
MLSTEFALPPDGTATVAQSPEYLRAKVKAQIIEGKPTFFKFEAQLPKGRTDTPLAASDKMWVVLKTYAADGENGLHAHPNEDHTFVVLQGEATFYGKASRIRLAIAGADADHYGQVPHGRPPAFTINRGKSFLDLPCLPIEAAVDRIGTR